jgi:hypothetical protein
MKKLVNNKKQKGTNKTLNLVNEIRKVVLRMTPEKTIDTGGVIAITAAGTITTINFPTVQGTANGQRTGDEIYLDRLEFRSTCYFGDPAGNVVRIIILQMRGSPAGLVVSDILSPGSSGFPDVNSFYTPFVNGKRYNILYDKKHIMIPSAMNSTVSIDKTFSVILKKIAFTPGGTFAETGQFYMFTISDSGILPNPALDYVYRIYYQDV